MSKIFIKSEYTICQRYNLSVQDYYDMVKSREAANDEYESALYHPFRRDVTKRLKAVETAIRTAVEGKPPVVHFDFAPELTREKTLQAFRLILASNVYLHYQAVRGYLVEHGGISQTVALGLAEQSGETRRARRFDLRVSWSRSAIMRRLGVPKAREAEEDYRITLGKAYYTYAGADKAFETNMETVVRTYFGLRKRIVSACDVLPVLSSDPFEMSELEFAAFYARLEQEAASGCVSGSPKEDNKSGTEDAESSQGIPKLL